MYDPVNTIHYILSIQIGLCVLYLFDKNKKNKDHIDDKLKNIEDKIKKIEDGSSTNQYSIFQTPICQLEIDDNRLSTCKNDKLETSIVSLIENKEQIDDKLKTIEEKIKNTEDKLKNIINIGSSTNQYSFI